MTKQLQPTEAGTKGIRRLVRKQVDKALKVLSQGDDGPLTDEDVHDVRKRLKKVRAYLRLLREALGSRRYQRGNAAFRDCARPLTDVRDAKVLVETLDKLAERFGEAIDPEALAAIRRALQEYQQEVRRSVLEDHDALKPMEQSLERAEERVERWPVGRHGWSILGAGLKRVYRAGRDAYQTAQDDPSVENLHEWRKQVKYLGYQLQLLQPLQPDVLGPLVEQTRTLGRQLGDEHDLAVLGEKLQADAVRFSDRATVEELLAQIGRCRAECQEQAQDLGHRLFEEKPKQFTRRLKGHWRCWRSTAGAAAQERDQLVGAGQQD